MSGLWDKCCKTAHKVEEKAEGLVKSKEAQKKDIETKLGAIMPAVLKPCSACCGPVKTLDTFSFAVPSEQRESVKQSIDLYKKL
mmetsp:Transcript_55362/g.132069  ORF Transcript_55362/g.132069 Transcript_55362/m.132069 type:complete len:84 (+) Transcript_55362:94-345(+)|eukprot:CAMPEP_0178388424 /NCGR_PEP_ID=MMETSP0689_2-20121128/9586_1 /TAXON_ID=160604 /ORGANISM="Amphidinium massartii, Strain CS-259" /LENGTH=83 /DNA_ID=CAMNT_0020008827 /DNA_START=90 /DNA_END=341 /DNA_ORIENTATION=+